EKIFPNKTTEEAVQALWDEINKMVRVDQPDVIQAWDEHNKRLETAYKILNVKQYAALRLRAPGTDIEVELAKNHVWQGGAAESEKGTVLNPNIPRDGVLTAPHKYKGNGTVPSTR